ncbi:MAG: hypothetical protein ACI9W2_002586 [Gammaproteobacteria bacterium]|jgi:hypothetical protein
MLAKRAAGVVRGYLGDLLGSRNLVRQEKMDRLEEELVEARDRAEQAEAGVNLQQENTDRLEQELDEARGRAGQVNAGINVHFEQSAVLFGQLARDYGAFLSHLQTSARELGLSEGQTENLLERAARPLLSHAGGNGADGRPPEEPATLDSDRDTDGKASMAKSSTDDATPLPADPQTVAQVEKDTDLERAARARRSTGAAGLRPKEAATPASGRGINGKTSTAKSSTDDATSLPADTKTIAQSEQDGDDGAQSTAPAEIASAGPDSALGAGGPVLMPIPMDETQADQTRH